MPRSLKNCNNFQDLKDLARRRLPGPIFHYIDGAAEDETTYQRNTEAFQNVDLVPNVLAGVENIDMSVEVMGYKLGLPIFCSPTALQRLFHHQGERAVAKAAEKVGNLSLHVWAGSLGGPSGHVMVGYGNPDMSGIDNESETWPKVIEAYNELFEDSFQADQEAFNNSLEMWGNFSEVWRWLHELSSPAVSIN